MRNDQKLFNRIHKILKAGPSQEAVDLINKTLTADPGLSDRWLTTAMELGYRGNYDRADDYFLVLYCVRQGDPGIMHLIAINTWLQGQNETAIGMCRDLIGKYPEVNGAYLTLADAQYGVGRYKEALDSYNVFLETEAENVSAWCGKGLALRALGREEEAEACFGRALELEPGCALRNFYTARHQVSCELYREALIFLEVALALDPGFKQAWFEKGSALLHTGRFQEALSCLDRVEGDASLAIQVLALRAWLYHMMSEDGPANACLDKWLELEPANPAAWLGKGAQLLSESRCEEAIHFIEKGLEMDGSNSIGWHGLGTAQGQLGRDEDALASFDRALALNPRFAQAWFDKGNLLLKMCRYGQAKPCFVESLKYDERNAEAWMNAGYLCYLEGYYREALQNYTRCLELKPESDEILNYIGITVGKMGRLKESLYFLEEALERNPDSAEALYNRSCTLAALEAK